MIRPFSLRDLTLVRRLGDQGTLLHAESALIGSCQPLRGALLNMVSRRDSATYIWRDEASDAAGFIQLYLPDGQAHAHLLCLGATPDGEQAEANAESRPLNEDAWLSLLEGAIAAMGRRGLHSLIAEVDESGPELPLLRRAGFAVYTRQDIWIRQGQWSEDETDGSLLQVADEVDAWDVEWLYANTVPPLIQLVEPTPPGDGKIWILRENDGDLAAFVHIHEGALAYWLQIYIHPGGFEQSQSIVEAAAALCNPEKAIYCCVRRYQSWLQHALQESGFQHCKSQAVMVKHIAMPAQKKAGELNRLLQTHRARATSMLEEYGPAVVPAPRWSRSRGPAEG